MSGISYAVAGDVHIAYTVRGEGERVIVVMLGGFIPVDLLDSEPRLRRFLQRLEHLGRVVVFNRRGIGLSDPAWAGLPTLEDWATDFSAVLDDMGVAAATVVACLGDVKVAFTVAALAPNRVERIIAINGAVQPITTVLGMTSSALEDRYRHDLSTKSRSANDEPDQLAWAAPSVAHDEAFRAWWVSAGRRGASPSTARSLLLILSLADVTAHVESTTCPVLVIQRTDSVVLPRAAGRFIASRAVNAQLCELPGADLLCWIDAEPVLGEIELALTGTRLAPDAELGVRTMLFTDIVASTERIAAVGNRGWRTIIELHDALTHEVVSRFGGSVVNTTGDGVLAQFSSPSHAVRAAMALLAEIRPHAITMRAGLHAAEVDLSDHGLSGIGVHLAARVAGLAEAGQVLVSRTIADLLLSSDLRFNSIGDHALKGVPGTWELYEALVEPPDAVTADGDWEN